MVVFACSHCGESLQKPKVEKHYNTKCRGGVSVSCMDCFKDFNAETYVHHTKCITEEERYSAKGFTMKANANKGLAKQEKWISTIQKILKENPKLPEGQRNVLNMIVKHENVPRKKPKYINFIRSAYPRINIKDAEVVFDLLAKEHSQELALNQAAKNNASAKQNGNATKPAAQNGVNKEDNSTESDKFKWKPTILHFVNKNKTIKNKNLMKKVLAVYKTFHPEISTEVPKDVIQTYNNKLLKMKKILVENELVKLRQ